jgi:Fe-S-cluster containining protein
MPPPGDHRVAMSSRLPVLLRDRPSPARLPTVEALDALWREVTARPLWAPPNQWRYLKLRWRMRLQLLDPLRIKVAAPAGKVNDCASCSDICCIGPRSTVLLRLTDIATLIDVGRTELVSTAKPRFSEAQLAERPALRRTVASDAWQVFPSLRQNAFHACEALSADGLCTLYPHWPLSCARFPYSLHTDEVEAFYSQRCDSYWIRPDAQPQARAMARTAVESYNARIKDWVLLEYARDRLEALGLIRFLQVDSAG